MTSIRLACLLVAFAALSAPLPAQQMEMNDAGGSLTSRGNNPTPGSPFSVGTNQSIDLEVGGTPLVPYSLIVGNLAATSLPVPPLNGQFFDLDLASAAVVGDGIGGSGALPPAFFFLDAQGSSVWSFPLTPVAAGLRVAFQAVVTDAAQAPVNLNLTAAPEFVVTTEIVLTGSEVANFVFPSGGYVMYGSTFSSMDVSTSGWLRFGSGAVSSDPFVVRSAFLGGTVGGAISPAPIVAPLWTPLFFAGATSRVRIREVTPFITQVDWIDAMSFLAPGPTSAGTFVATIDNTSGVPLIAFDYTGFVYSSLMTIPGVSGDICGVTDGGTVGAALNEVNLVSNGTVNPFAPGTITSIFQEFGPQSPLVEAVDLDGVVMQLVDGNGAGLFSLF